MNAANNSQETVSSTREIYTPSTFAKENLLYLQEIGTLKAQKPHTSKRENLNSYLFIIVHSGDGTLFYEDTIYKLSAGDYIFINCNLGYYHETSVENPWELSWIHFNGSIAEKMYNKYIEQGGTSIFKAIHTDKYQEIYQNIFQKASNSLFLFDMEINTELFALLSELMFDASMHDSNSIGKKNDLDKIKEYLTCNYKEKIVLDELAQHYHINKFYLTRIFKKQFGISINNYLLSVRITHAKSMLRFSDHTMDSIGISCGIGNGYYFSRVFKQIEGVSPNEYRKIWKTN